MSDSPLVLVGDVMSADVHSIGRMATVEDAIAAMREAGVSSLVVERRDAVDEYGLIVIADIAREVIAKDRAAERVNVYEVMSKPLLTVPGWNWENSKMIGPIRSATASSGRKN